LLNNFDNKQNTFWRTVLKLSIFLQARLNSRRLPNKIIKPLSGKTLIEQIISRLRKSFPLVNNIVIATCDNSYSILHNIFKTNSDIIVFSGPEDNVLERFYLANKQFNADIIIRATADNPFVSIGHLNSAVQHHINNNADITYYTGLPLGSGVEIINPLALNIAHLNADKPYQLEHVTPYIYENKDQFNVQELITTGMYNRPDIRLTIDEEDDFQVAERIFQSLFRGDNDFPLSEIINVWDNESLYHINKNVKQRLLV